MNRKSVHSNTLIEKYILEQIDNGTFSPGKAIPSERELAKELNVTRNTIKKAISNLVDSGQLITRQGSGTYVKKFDSSIFLGNIHNNKQSGMNELIRLTGKIPSNKVIDATVISSDTIIDANLALNNTEKVFSLARVRYSDNVIYAFEHSMIPIKFFPTITSMDFSQISLYNFMEENGHKVTTVSRTLSLIKSNEIISKYLQIPLETVIYEFTFIGTDADSNIVEYTKSYMRMDQVHFSTQI